MKKVTVLGDPVSDHNFYRGLRASPDSTEERGLRTQPTPGGARLLCDLLEKTLAQSRGCPVQFGLEVDFEKLPPRYHAYALWEPQPSDLLEKDTKKIRQVWRAAEPPLGYGNREPDPQLPPSYRRFPLDGTDILVLDDAGLDFRNEPVTLGKHEWIVLKLTGSIGEGALWESLATARPDNLLIILSADQLRLADIRLCRALSWEATIQNLLRELDSNPVLAPLKIAQHIIVTFRSDAAFWLPNPSSAPSRPFLVFDGERAEGEWRTATGPGIVFGYLSCFTAAIVYQLCTWAPPANPDSAVPPPQPDFEGALIAGLTASRQLHRLGHGPVQPDVNEKPDPADKDKKIKELSPHPGFPYAEIGEAIRSGASNSERFATTALPAIVPQRDEWMLLDEWYVHAADANQVLPYHDAAFAAAILGPGALERFPVARFGDLLTVDRREIEGLRIVRQAMQDYRDNKKTSKPLNLGVFGPPGAGKSFGVIEIVKAVFGKDAPRPLTFNLSQFSSPEMLNGAFHQIRDEVVAGKIPVAFWDEFDSESFRWLQYLLAPMNDGVFQEGPITHPIGKCIFIFAGATSHSFDTFGPPDPADTDHPDHVLLNQMEGPVRDRVENAWRDFVLKKGPDFKSRLIATLDVLGPNPRQLRTLNPTTGYYTFATDPADRCWPIRRAFFIRSKLPLTKAARLEIDHSLLRALLEIPRYKSGARSLEFLCAYLRHQAGSTIPRRSHLPGNPLLDRHVNAKDFQEISDADTRFHDAAEALAPGLHDSWRNLAATDNPADQPWDILATTYRQSTIQQALRIPRNLIVTGLTVEKGNFPAEQQAAAQSLVEENLERLAEAEHNGWMVERMLAGWRYGRTRDNERKRHPLLLPYNQLSEAELEKDRQAVRSYVQRLAGANYRIILPPKL